MRTTWLWVLALAVIGWGLIGCDGDAKDTNGDTTSDGDLVGECEPGEMICRGDDLYRCTTNGEWSFYVNCAGQGYVCRDGECGPREVDVPDGDIADGDVADGDVADGDVPDGDVPDGDVPDGDDPDGDVPDGDAPDGDDPDGDVPDGDDPDGDVPDGDDPDGDDPEPLCEGACDEATDTDWCVDSEVVCLCFEDEWVELSCSDVADYYGYNLSACEDVAESGSPEYACVLGYDCTDGAFVNASCEDLLYNPCTCAASDPCDWSDDGYCDDFCQFVVETPFDDAGDCNCETMDYDEACSGRFYNACVCADFDPCGWLRDGYCDNSCHYYDDSIDDGVDCGTIDTPGPGELGGPCTFGQVNPTAGSCAGGLSCVGAHANASSAQPAPCTNHGDCRSRFGPAGVCAQGYCGVSWCTTDCVQSDPNACADMDIGNERACCQLISGDPMCYIPDLCVQPGSRGPGQTCTFGPLYRSAGKCQSGLSCIGVYADGSSTLTIPCSSDATCRGAGGFSDSSAVCVNGYCGIAWCADSCTENTDCTDPGYGAPSGCCGTVGTSERCYRASFCE